MRSRISTRGCVSVGSSHASWNQQFSRCHTSKAPGFWAKKFWAPNKECLYKCVLGRILVDICVVASKNVAFCIFLHCVSMTEENLGEENSGFWPRSSRHYKFTIRITQCYLMHSCYEIEFNQPISRNMTNNSLTLGPMKDIMKFQKKKIVWVPFANFTMSIFFSCLSA